MSETIVSEGALEVDPTATIPAPAAPPEAVTPPETEPSADAPKKAEIQPLTRRHKILKSLLALAMATVIPSASFEIHLQDDIRTNNTAAATTIEHYYSPELASKRTDLDRGAERLPRQYDTCWYGFDGFGSNRWKSIDEALTHLLLNTTSTKISGVHYGYDERKPWLDTISQELDEDTADCKTISFAGVSLGALTAMAAREGMRRQIPIQYFVIFDGPARQNDTRHPGAVSFKQNTHLPITALGLTASKVWNCGFSSNCYADGIDQVTHGAPMMVQDAQASLLANASGVTDQLRAGKQLFAPDAQTLFIIPRQPERDTIINPERSALSWQEILPTPFSIVEADGGHGVIYTAAHTKTVEYVFATTPFGGLGVVQQAPTHAARSSLPQ